MATNTQKALIVKTVGGPIQFADISIPKLSKSVATNTHSIHSTHSALPPLSFSQLCACGLLAVLQCPRHESESQTYTASVQQCLSSHSALTALALLCNLQVMAVALNPVDWKVTSLAHLKASLR